MTCGWSARSFGVAGKRRANGEGTVYRDAARGVYVAQKYVRTLDGRLKRITARGGTVRHALDALRSRERTVGGSSVDGDRVTVRQYLERWLDHKSASVKPRTLREYRQVIEQHAIPSLGLLVLSKVRPAHVQVVVDALARAGKRTAAFNLRRYLNQAFEQAVDWEYISRNPVRGVSQVEVEPPQRGLWTLDEVTAFLSSARERTWYYPMFLTAIVTGLRQGELVALPWVNVTRASVTVDRTWSRDALVGYDTPKTRHAYRAVPISEDVHAVLLERHERTGSRLVFPTEAGTMASPWNAHRAFVQQTRRAGVPRIRFHDLRRIAATLWARQGIEPKVIARLLGHSTPHLALSVYQGVLDERVEAARLDARMLFGCYAVRGDGQSGVVGDAGGIVPERVVN